MGNFAAEYGIFVPCSTITEDFKVNCIKEILIICPTSCIRSVIDDEEFEGIRIYFADILAVENILNKRYLKFSGNRVGIYPLVTNLTIQNVIAKSNVDPQKELEKVMENKFGKVLKIFKIPLSKEFPDIDTGKWQVLLDIPELDHLEIFNQIGSSGMTLKSLNLEREIKIALFCRKCGGKGHTQRRCLDKKAEVKSNSLAKITTKSDGKQEPKNEENRSMLNKSHVNPNLHLKPSVSTNVAVVSPVAGNSSSSTQKHEHDIIDYRKMQNLEVMNLCKADNVLPRGKKMKHGDEVGKKYENVSPWLESCFIKSSGVLDSQKLQSYFSHVKKSHNPEEVAKLYTEDVKGLVKQMQSIVSIFYAHPKSGSKEDKYFIKWLQNLIERLNRNINKNMVFYQQPLSSETECDEKIALQNSEQVSRKWCLL